MNEALKNDLEEVSKMIGDAQAVFSEKIESIEDIFESIKKIRTILNNTQYRLKDIIEWDYSKEE